MAIRQCWTDSTRLHDNDVMKPAWMKHFKQVTAFILALASQIPHLFLLKNNLEQHGKQSENFQGTNTSSLFTCKKALQVIIWYFFPLHTNSDTSFQTSIYSLWVAKSLHHLNGLEYVPGQTATCLSYIPLNFCLRWNHRQVQDTWSRYSLQILIKSHSLIFQWYRYIPQPAKIHSKKLPF